MTDETVTSPERLHFLIVEDDPGVVRSYERQLQRDVELRVATTFEEGCAALEQQRDFAAVMLDLYLPGQGNGLKLLERVRGSNRDVPCVLVSAGYDPDVVNRANALGAEWLAKPLLGENFTRLVERARLYRHQAVLVPCDVTTFSTRYNLTLSETRVLELAVRGMPYREIAVCLNVANQTVRRHASKIRRKAGTRTLKQVLVRLLSNKKPS